LVGEDHRFSRLQSLSTVGAVAEVVWKWLGSVLPGSHGSRESGEPAGVLRGFEHITGLSLREKLIS
jgi:hypothetical protein